MCNFPLGAKVPRWAIGLLQEIQADADLAAASR